MTRPASIRRETGGKRESSASGHCPRGARPSGRFSVRMIRGKRTSAAFWSMKRRKRRAPTTLKSVAARRCARENPEAKR
jgi:hypothetical protein